MGRKPLSLAGKTFGLLTVIKQVDGKDTRASYWLCRCKCGNERVVAGSSLKRGATVSCGCINDKKRRERFTDKTGQRFGKLVVLRKTDKRSHGKIVWECRCDCGNICEVAADNLGRDTTSCGCVKTDMLLEDVVEGTRLRNLTKKKGKRINRDSGVKGVTWDTKRNKWRVQIMIRGRNISLGRYKEEEELDEAIEVRKKAEEAYFRPIIEKYGKEFKEENINPKKLRKQQ